MNVESVWNDAEDLKGAVWGMGGPHRCGGAGGTST